MALRSGTRYQARNQPFYTSVRELLQHHQRLLTENPAVTQQLAVIERSGTLVQTTIRFPVQSDIIQTSLREVFTELLAQLQRNEHYEVLITFNAILHNPVRGTYSLFYGHDFRHDNRGGRARELSFYDTSTIVRTPFDVNRIPVNIDYDRLLRAHRDVFDDSGVQLHSFVNIIYLVYKYVPTVIRQHV
jgi:hypothetical protein